MITLREITIENIDQIRKLIPTENQKRFVASTEASLVEAGANPNYAWCRAIYSDDIPVGFAMVGMNPQEDFSFLWRFMIDARYQKKGYGKKALALVIEEIKSKANIKKIITSYRDGEGNPGDFYRGIGFKEVENLEEFGELGEKIKRFGEVALELRSDPIIS